MEEFKGMIYGFSIDKNNYGYVNAVVNVNGTMVLLTKNQLKVALSKYYNKDVFVGDEETGVEFCVPTPDTDKWWNKRLSLYEISSEDDQNIVSGRQPYGHISPLSCIEIARQSVH